MTSSPSDREPAPPSWVQRLWTTPWLWLAFIIPLFCVPLFIGLDRTDLDNDEAIYSFAVETMVKDGDWLTPKSIPSETRPFLEKPPLKFWITYVPMRLGLLPDDEFGLRFMDAAMSALAFLYVFGIGRKTGRSGLRTGGRPPALLPPRAALRARTPQQQHGVVDRARVCRRRVSLPRVAIGESGRQAARLRDGALVRPRLHDEVRGRPVPAGHPGPQRH